MGGQNCAIVGCGACKSRHKGLSFHLLPKKGVNDVWRSQLLRAINRCDDFNINTAAICSRHFEEECFTTHGRSRKLKVGSLPTKCMPVKSIITPTVGPRKPPAAREAPPLPERVRCCTLTDIKKDVSKVAHPWTVSCNTEDKVSFWFIDNDIVTIKVNIVNTANPEVLVQGFAVDLSNISLEKLGLTKYLSAIASTKLCPAIVDEMLQQYASTNSLLYAKEFKNDSTAVRSNGCARILSSTSDKICARCKAVQSILAKSQKKAAAASTVTLHPKTPLTKASKSKLINELKASRVREKKLQKQLISIKTKIQREAVDIDSELHESLREIMDTEKLADPFVKLFWEEQQRAFSRPIKGMRWHPMMIRFAIMIRSQSPEAYESLRETGVLKLPGSSTLRDYTNVFHPKTGFQPEVLHELEVSAKNLREHERFVVLLHDEMTIKSNLVFEKKSGEIVGFIQQDKWTFTEKMDNNLATHALVFMVVGINTHIKFSLGFFGTRTATADELYPLFWQAVGYLEISCNLKVIASTSDKASPNQKLYRILGSVDISENHKTVNMFAPSRDIYLFSDAPHLIKTVRNNLSSSKAGGTRYLWNNGRYLLWKHVMDVYHHDVESHLYRTKLTYDHIYLTPFSVMKVKLAAQVLSSSVGNVMRDYFGKEAGETAIFLLHMDNFFDCLNTRALQEGKLKRKPYLEPYYSVNDARFEYLKGDFLNYLKGWKQSVLSRPGEFTNKERLKMFLSPQTYEGLVMTVHSLVEATQYLLQNGVRYVLSQVFCQDPLEEHFGRHRALARRSDNPSLSQLGYQENKLRLQRSLALQLKPRGNVAVKTRCPVLVSTSPMKKARH